jgi:hypothetical protein
MEKRSLRLVELCGYRRQEASMVHPDLRLQKYKGNDEPLGRAVEVGLEEDCKGPAGMKKWQSKVSEDTGEYIEI